MSINDIKGVNKNRTQNTSFYFDLGDAQSLDISVELPAGGHRLPSKPVISCSAIDLTQSKDFYREFEACLPLARMNLINDRYPLKLTGQLKAETDGYDLDFRLLVVVLDCEDCQPLYDARQFEGAIDRNLYTCWGPGAFKYDYDSGLNRNRQTINEVDWIVCDTKFRSTSYNTRDNLDILRSCYTVINSRYMLELTFQISGRIAKRLNPLMQSFLNDLQQVLTQSVRLHPNNELKQDIQKQRSQYSQHYRENDKGPLDWPEKPVQSLFLIQNEIDVDESEQVFMFEDVEEGDGLFDMGYRSPNAFDKALLYSPYRPEHRDKLIEPPWQQVRQVPGIKEWLARNRQLIEQMRASYASHSKFD